MISKLKRFLISFYHYFNSPNKISKSIGNDEKIARAIYSPMNLHDKKQTLLPNAFKPPVNSDELSVNRLDYATADFCKKEAKKHSSPENRRSYYGFAILTKKEIIDLNCDIVYSPIKKPAKDKNLFHSDIKIGYIMKRGEPPPSEVSKKINDLTKVCRFYADPNTETEIWSGSQLI
jgi:hypothetical protein